MGVGRLQSLLQSVRRSKLCVWAVVLALTLGPVPTAAHAEGGPLAWQGQMKDRVTGTAMSADGSLVAFGSRSGEVWLVRRDGETVARWQAPNAVNGVAMSADGSSLAVVADNQQIYLLNGAGQVQWQAATQGAGYSVALADDGNRVAVGTWDGVLQVFDRQGAPLWEQRLTDRVYALAFSARGERLLSGLRRGTVTLWNGEGGALWAQEMDSAVRGLALSGQADLIAAGTEAGQFALLDGQGATLRQQPLGRGPLRGVAMDADGSRIAVAADDGQLYLFERSGDLILRQAIFTQLYSVALSADGQWLSIGAGDGAVGSMTLAGAQEARQTGLCTRWLSRAGLATGLLAVIAATTLLLTRTATGRRQQRRVGVFWRRIWRHRVAYLLVMPSLLLLIVFSYYPAYSAIFHAFTRWSPGISTEFVGLANFRKALQDQYLWIGVGNLLILLITGALKAVTMPLLVAELVFHLRSARARYAYRMTYVLPMVVPGMVATLLWRMIYDPEIGLINQTLRPLGLGSLARPWLADAGTALGALIFMGFPWVGTIAFLVYYAALIEIPEETLDATRIDGATGWRRIWYIDIPLVSPQLKLMLLLSYIGRMQGFQDILVMTGGGPASSTYVPALEMYYAAFRFGDFGYASAIAMLLFVVILGGSILSRRQSRSQV